MRLSAKAQYACVAMLDLACAYRDPNPVHLKHIAEKHGISQRFLVQIMLQLKGAGLVDSTRGATGGYLLTKSPGQISLADIVHAIDQPPPPAPSALSGLYGTPAVQVVSDMLQDAQDREQRRLAEVTLEDLVKQHHQRSELVYQI
ncbi:MAG: Rrf2 family transcriptional regulator [Planctomycetes bacterium]|nr:Rrf2 family transcriptional regulator [Planctomycetota bacterium]